MGRGAVTLVSIVFQCRFVWKLTRNSINQIPFKKAVITVFNKNHIVMMIVIGDDCSIHRKKLRLTENIDLEFFLYEFNQCINAELKWSVKVSKFFIFPFY